MGLPSIVWLLFSVHCFAGLLYVFRPELVESILGHLDTHVLIQQIGVATLGLGALAFSVRGLEKGVRHGAVLSLLALHLLVLAIQGYFHFVKAMAIPPLAIGVTGATAVLLLLGFFEVVPSRLTLLLFGVAWSARSIFFLVKPDVVIQHIIGFELGPTREVLFYPLGLILVFTGVLALQVRGVSESQLAGICGALALVNFAQAAAVFATTPIYDVPFLVKVGAGLLLLVAYLAGGKDAAQTTGSSKKAKKAE